MRFKKIKSYAKINLALNVLGKSSKLHKIESLVAFINIYDLILIKRINKKNHIVKFRGKFSKNINSNNSVTKLLRILDKKKLLQEKFHIEIVKHVPQQSGLGGGSMNAASILNYFIKEKIFSLDKEKIHSIVRYIGSDVILGLTNDYQVLTSKNQTKKFKNCKKLYTLVVKPNFGCSTKAIYADVRNYETAKFNTPRKKMFNLNFLKKMSNSLEKIVLIKHPILKKIKIYLTNLYNPEFVRMTGSGSAFIAYYNSKKKCDKALKQFNKEFDAIEAIYKHLIFHAKGRLIYVGAGTSARIGVQDGIELYPTFNWPKERLDFIIAGGINALLNAIENAEGDREAILQLGMAMQPEDLQLYYQIGLSGRSDLALVSLGDVHARLRHVDIVPDVHHLGAVAVVKIVFKRDRSVIISAGGRGARSAELGILRLRALARVTRAGH